MEASTILIIVIGLYQIGAPITYELLKKYEVYSHVTSYDQIDNKVASIICICIFVCS